MKTTNDGGPAFPVTTIGETGMSIRDWFAGQALSQLALDYVSHQAAGEAYEYADVMLAERSKTSTT